MDRRPVANLVDATTWDRWRLSVMTELVLACAEVALVARRVTSVNPGITDSQKKAAQVSILGSYSSITLKWYSSELSR